MPGLDVDTEALLRQVLVSNAGLSEKVAGMAAGMEDIKNNAREARDAARDIAAATKAQDIPAKIAELRGFVEKTNAELRSDMVNSNTRITSELRTDFDKCEKDVIALDTRVEALEAVHNRALGMTGVIGWLSRYAPWLISAVAFVLSFAGYKDHHP